ncbi:DUF72 domain-containing protein [Chelatococcus sp. SYSU_G07232]|uniref:DUF72 domain-containing protein n=1 Tax=Chelatococcus albus TaxID=3047466 RepID=A0ABT7AIJ6_9HYPH|nr:DUF72 domain-containing protein [Chelatococcus sp. SYSU_G07232]MDJ1159195.1 DUF72 domain-containing protein [Chelatococcus sp. SYSU_G07232]
MAGAIHIGTSGWAYPHWRGVFFPPHLPQAEWLAFYTAHFRTVELNASFYRLPTEATIDRWHALAPPGFVYAVKASRLVTHLKRLAGCEEPLALFFARVRRLGEHLGPVLFQLPPRLAADVGLLTDFAGRLPVDLVHVFEFRDASWFTPKVRDCLADHGLAFCIHDHGGIACPDWVTARTVYHRFHGFSRSRLGAYGPARLAGVAARMKAEAAAGHEVYAYFNNDAWGCAVADARCLAGLLGTGEDVATAQG